MLKIEDLTVAYGRVRAVNGLSLHVDEGEFVGLVGHNGAGKTSTLMTIIGVQRPASGRIIFDGSRSRALLARRDTPDAGSRSCPRAGGSSSGSRSARTSRSAPSLAATAPRWRKTSNRMRERFPVLAETWDRSGAKLSGGEQQQLAIARGAARRSAAPAPRRADARARSADRRPGVRDPPGAERGGSHVLLVEQNAKRTIEVADRTYVMRTGGRIQFQGRRRSCQASGDFETRVHRHGEGGAG